MVEIATKKDISVKRICDIIGYDKGTVSRAVRRIESLGLAAVRVDEDDSRVRRISLTPAGRRMHRQLEAIALQRRNFLESIFTKKERNQLVSLLQRLHAHVPKVARFDPLQNQNKTRRRR
jgi:DNA-binding MarR family transcriptional regulator